jgi:hypothetical protein
MSPLVGAKYALELPYQAVLVEVSATGVIMGPLAQGSGVPMTVPEPVIALSMVAVLTKLYETFCDVFQSVNDLRRHKNVY